VLHSKNHAHVHTTPSRHTQSTQAATMMHVVPSTVTLFMYTSNMHAGLKFIHAPTHWPGNTCMYKHCVFTSQHTSFVAQIFGRRHNTRLCGTQSGQDSTDATSDSSRALWLCSHFPEAFPPTQVCFTPHRHAEERDRNCTRAHTHMHSDYGCCSSVWRRKATCFASTIRRYASTTALSSL